MNLFAPTPRRLCTGAAVLGLIGPLVLMTATTGSAATAKASPATGPCRPNVVTDRDLPVWARTGFHGSFKVPHSVGRNGQIVAVLFGNPLQAPAGSERANKILWVPRTTPPSQPLVIVAQRIAPPARTPVWPARDQPTVRRQLDLGPGPSIVDMPSAGCWRLSLAWAGRRDSIDLEYGAPDPTDSHP